MIVLSYISFGFVIFQFLNVLLNFIFRQKLPQSNCVVNNQISVLIPARNEEENIRLLLTDLIKINDNILEIIVFDDQSTDNTFRVVKQISKIDQRIKLKQMSVLPENWLGKNHACYQLARYAKGNYLLFLDADVRVKENIIKDAMCYAEKYHLSLLSVFPLQIQKSWGEKLTVSIMNYILLSLLPLIFVRVSPFSSHAAANGQFMLFNACIYKQIQPHKILKSSPVEDIAIANLFKKKKIKIACLIGDNRIRCRMYRSYKEALNGFTKNIFMFFGNKPFFAFLFWFFSFLGILPVIFLGTACWILYLIFVFFILIIYSSLSGQCIISNILLFPMQMFFLLQVMLNNIFIKKKQVWKDRDIFL